MSQTENRYPHISKALRIKFERVNINIDDLLEDYEIGRRPEVIQLKYKINEEQLNVVLKACLIPEIRQKRKEQLKRRESNLYAVKIGTPDDEIERIPLNKAIALVEGEKEEEEGEEK